VFRENVARQTVPEAQKARDRADLPAVALQTQHAEEGEPTRVSEVVVTARRPDWLHRQLRRARTDWRIS
jgi:hypothetical protein